MNTSLLVRLRGLVAAAPLVTLWACTATIVDDRADPPSRAPAGVSGGETPMNSGGSPSGPATPMACDRAPAVGPAPLRPLSPGEYARTLKDLLGFAPKVTVPKFRDPGSFDNDIKQLTVSSIVVESQLGELEAAAKTAATEPAKLLPCAPATADDDCVRKFITTFGQRAYRRPLEAADVESVLASYKAGRAAGGVTLALEYALEHMMLAPHFQYRVEIGETAVPGQPRRLTSWEMASRLSYFLWGSMPDAALFTAAGEGQLATREQVLAQVRRMMRGPDGQPVPAARAMAADFNTQWLGLDGVDTVDKNNSTYPTFSALRKSIRAESDRFMDELFWNKGTTTELLTARHSYLDEGLASLYKVAGVTGPGFRRVDLDPRQRAGILTHPSVMAVTSGDKTPSPIKRGLYVRERILCTEIPAPVGEIPELPPATMFRTERERYAMHSQNPACAGCHKLFDTVGFSFEFYDAVGGYRTEYPTGAPIDGSGALTQTDVDGPFTSAVELALRMGRSQHVQACVTRHWYRYMQGRHETAEDACALQAVNRQVASTGGRLEDLVVALATSDAFLLLPPQKTP